MDTCLSTHKIAAHESLGTEKTRKVMAMTHLRSDLRRCLVILMTMTMAGCAGAPTLAEREAKAASVAQGGQLEKFRIATKRFDLVGFRRVLLPGQPLTVFIEGDGESWKSGYRPSDDPTPVSTTVLRIATANPGSNTVYLARPCQFTGAKNGTARNCRPYLWTLAPYSEEVVAAMDEALNKIKAQTGSFSLRLVGYSGGGAIATLLAARRKDVVSLVTIAGLLDSAAFTSLHNVSPLNHSLDPLSVATKIAQLPQIHYAGGKDDIVPPMIAASFIRHMPPNNCAQQIVIPDIGHHDDWAALWPGLAMHAPACPADRPKSGISGDLR